MSEIFDSTKYISTKDASLLFPYSSEHIGRLARSKKIFAIESGRKWFVDVNSLQTFYEVSLAEDQIRQARLSYQRRQEMEVKDRLVLADSLAVSLSQKNFFHTLAILTALGAVSLLSFGQVSFSVSPVIQKQSALVVNSGGVNGGQIYFPALATEETIQLSESGGVVLLPSGTENPEIAGYFSDEVIVEELSSDKSIAKIKVGDTTRVVPLVIIPFTQTGTGGQN